MLEDAEEWLCLLPGGRLEGALVAVLWALFAKRKHFKLCGGGMQDVVSQIATAIAGAATGAAAATRTPPLPSTHNLVRFACIP